MTITPVSESVLVSENNKRWLEEVSVKVGISQGALVDMAIRDLRETPRIKRLIERSEEGDMFEEE